jgi:hypothetical protein
MVSGVMPAVWQLVMSPVSQGGEGACGMGVPSGRWKRKWPGTVVSWVMW